MAGFTKAPAPSPYRAAQLLARSRAGALTQQSAQRVVSAIDEYAKALANKLAALPVGTPAAQRAALEAAAKIAKGATLELQSKLAQAVAGGRDLAFKDVLSVWEHAGLQAAKSVGVADRLLGGIAQPNVTMAGAFESLGGVPFLKSLNATGKAAGAEVSAILRSGLTSGVSPDELARRLRPYVTGAEVFEKAFPKTDERLAALHTARAKLPKELRGAAGRLRSNALRVAYSEVHNARAEAELHAFALDPLIGAVQWELSPFRGSQADPDACDAFAVNNWYGLGVGIYPLDSVPLPPHPRDRCERVPVYRPPEQWGNPKPAGLKRKLKPVKAKLGANAGQLTAVNAARIRDVVRGQLQQLDQHASKKAMQALLTHADKGATELVEIAAAREALIQSLQQAAADAAAAAVAAASEPTTIGLVTFPQKLEGEAFDAAKLLYGKAAYKKSTAALESLKAAGADTSKLEAHLANLKANAAAKKAAKKAAAKAEPPAVVPPKPVDVVTAPPAPAVPPPVPVPAPLVTFTPNATQVEAMQKTLKSKGVFLLTKAQITDNFEAIGDALTDLADTAAGPMVKTQAIATLKNLGANVKNLEAKLGLSGAKPIFSTAPAPKPPKPSLPPVAPPASVAAQIPTASAENVLFQKIGAQAGSNPGGLYVGKDGVKRYVKVYANAPQAQGEHLANAIYRELGLGAPESLTFIHEGKLHYASRFIEGAEHQTFGKLGVSAARARKALDGFAADVLTANWDAPGLTFDNLVEVGGKVYRVDNGSAFLYRATGKLKPTAQLTQITEWEGFAPGVGQQNPQYAELFVKAGLSSPEQLGQALVKQIDDILALEKKHGSWGAFVETFMPTPSPARSKIVEMLVDRTYLLQLKRESIAASLKAAPPIAAPPALPPAVHGAPSAVYAKVKTLFAAGTSKVAAQHGVYVGKSLIAGKKLNAFKKALAKAVEQGDDAAIAQLQAMGANVSALQKKLGKIPLAAPPAPAAAPAINAVPKVPASPLIKPADVPGVQAASKVQQPLYFNAGNSTATALKSGGVDLTKLPAGQVGFTLDAQQVALGSGQKQTLKAYIAAQNPTHPYGGTEAQFFAFLESSAMPKGLSAAGKRQWLVDKGYDAIVLTDTSGTVTKVIALKPEIVKFVDEAVKPITPASVASPSYNYANAQGPVGARVDKGLGNRTPSDEPLTPLASETGRERQIREHRASFRSAFAQADREHLGKHSADALSEKDPVMKHAHDWRNKEMRAALVTELGVTPAQATKIQQAWQKSVREWFGSSSSDGAAVMKLAAEDVHGLNSTTYHGGYFDHDKAGRDRFTRNAEGTAARLGVTRAQMRAAYEIDNRIMRAFMMEALGVREGEVFKVWRGVSSDYFNSHHMPVPSVGEEMTVTMNAMSSFSMNRPFSGIVLELEATLDDVAVVYPVLNPGGYYGEREIWILGRPRKMKRVQ